MTQLARSLFATYLHRQDTQHNLDCTHHNFSNVDDRFKYVQKIIASGAYHDKKSDNHIFCILAAELLIVITTILVPLAFVVALALVFLAIHAAVGLARGISRSWLGRRWPG